jgi:hypothetical protein
MQDNEADADDAQQQAQQLARRHRLAKQQRGQNRGEDRIGREDQPAQAGGD